MWPYSLPSVVPGAAPGGQAINLQVIKSSPEVGWNYFPPSLRSPSKPTRVTTIRLVSSYTAWWQRYIHVNDLPKVVMQLCPLIASPTPYCYVCRSSGCWRTTRLPRASVCLAAHSTTTTSDTARSTSWTQWIQRHSESSFDLFSQASELADLARGI